MNTRQEYQDELAVLRTRNHQLEEQNEELKIANEALRQELVAKHMRSEYLQEVLQRGGIKARDYAIARAAEAFIDAGLNRMLVAAGVVKSSDGPVEFDQSKYEQAMITLMEAVHPTEVKGAPE